MAAPASGSMGSIPDHEFYGKLRKRVRLVDIPDGSDDNLDDSDDFGAVDSDDDADYVPSDEESADVDGDVGTLSDDRDVETVPIGSTKKQTPVKGAKKKTAYVWKKTVFSPPPGAELLDEQPLHINEAFSKRSFSALSNPIDFFALLFPPDFIDEVAYQTNLYIVQKSDGFGIRGNAPIISEEIVKVLGMVLYMGVAKLPARRMYWAPATRVPAIAEVMARNRFDYNLSNLHFNDNAAALSTEDPGYDKLYKIRPLITKMQHTFLSAAIPETSQAIDEMMIGFKGRHSLKVYMPNKPTKWGYKLWARAGVSGYVYRFEVCGGCERGPPAGLQPRCELGESQYVVLRQIEALPRHKHKVFFDNLFSSPELLSYLSAEGFYAVCTLRSNRTRGCPITDEKVMKKEGRGTMEEYVEETGAVVISAWIDNKRVLTGSNYVRNNPVGVCSRYDKKQKRKIEVPRPAIVGEYNKFMGGVDKADMLLAFYKTKFKSRKWYLRIAFHLLSMAAVNSWMLYQSVGGKSPYLDFLIDICRCLMVGNLGCVSVATIPAAPIMMDVSIRGSSVPVTNRHDGMNHWPYQRAPYQCEGTPRRCQWHGCSCRTRFMCTKCRVTLCVVGSKCFRLYHGVAQ